MICPIPLSRIAYCVHEIDYAHELDNCQSEYGIRMSDWLEENGGKARLMLDSWWACQTKEYRNEWIARYRNELLAEHVRIENEIKQLTSLIEL